MQGMLRFFINSWKSHEIKLKNWFSGSFSEVFWLRLLMPYELRPKFWQMKDLLKIHNRGKVYEYSIFGCQVIDFPSFLCWFSIHEMALFGEVFGSNCPKYCQILLKCSPQVLFKEIRKVLYESLKNSNFYKNERYPEFPILVQLWTLFYPWRWLKSKKKKKKNFRGKNSAIGLSKNCKITYLFSPSNEK